MLDPFYLIVDHPDWLERLLPQGVKLVQLRMKDAAEAEMPSHIDRAKDICGKFGTTLVINDFWQAAIDAKAEWLHLGQGDLDTADIPAIRRAGLKIGISTHDEAELERALALNPDYVALGPIYPTILKQMPFAPQGLERIGEWKRKIGAIPLVGIGGISLERIAGVLEAGADSASVVTDVLLNAGPEARAAAHVAATRRFVHG